jgi:hypothetical protein
MTNPSDDDANAARNAATKKVRGKPFPKGRSANPAGKRPGTRHRKTLWIEAMSEGDRAAIIDKVIKLAKAGDRVALRMVTDRIDPPRKGRAVRFPLAPIKTTGDVVAALAAITEAMSTGQLSPAEAAEVAGVVELQRRAIETQEIEVRLHALEERFK